MSKKSKPRKRSPEALTDRLYKVVAQYLEARGWKPFIMGECAIQQQPDAYRHNYEFVVRFTGGRALEGKE
jgi:hypothetical protein